MDCELIAGLKQIAYWYWYEPIGERLFCLRYHFGIKEFTLDHNFNHEVETKVQTKITSL